MEKSRKIKAFGAIFKYEKRGIINRDYIAKND